MYTLTRSHAHTHPTVGRSASQGLTPHPIGAGGLWVQESGWGLPA